MTARVYRLSSDDKAGWYLGLTPAQVAVAVAGVVLGIVVTLSGGGAFTPFLLLLVGGVAVGRWHGQPILGLLPPLVRTLLGRFGRKTWIAPFDLLGRTDSTPPLPPALAGQQLVVLQPADWPELVRPAAVTCDTKAGTWAASFPVRGSDLALADMDERDNVIAGWGGALAGFSTSAAVESVRWTEWAAPAGIEEHEAWLSEQAHDNRADPVALDYRSLLRTAGRVAARHETLLTIVVATAKVKPPPGTDRAKATVGELLTEVRLFADRLAAAGLSSGPILSPAEMARALRVRLDPSCLPAIEARGRSLGDLTGAVRLGNAGPLSAAATGRSWRVDGSYHRAFKVADWPQRPVSADWLAGLLLDSSCTRSISVWFRPVPATVALAKVEHRAAQLDGDAQHRVEKGFRLGASFQAARRAVAEREAELVAGHAENSFTGVVAVTSPTAEALDRDSRDLIALAARWGVDLRPLDGRHDQGVGATLPLCRGIR